MKRDVKYICAFFPWELSFKACGITAKSSSIIPTVFSARRSRGKERGNIFLLRAFFEELKGPEPLSFSSLISSWPFPGRQAIAIKARACMHAFLGTLTSFTARHLIRVRIHFSFFLARVACDRDLYFHPCSARTFGVTKGRNKD